MHGYGNVFEANFTHKQNTFPRQPSDGCWWPATNFAVIFVVQATAHCYICYFYLVATSYKTVSVPKEKFTFIYNNLPYKTSSNKEAINIRTKSKPMKIHY
jgi:hypothetical protein